MNAHGVVQRPKGRHVNWKVFPSQISLRNFLCSFHLEMSAPHKGVHGFWVKYWAVRAILLGNQKETAHKLIWCQWDFLQGFLPKKFLNFCLSVFAPLETLALLLPVPIEMVGVESLK